MTRTKERIELEIYWCKKHMRHFARRKRELERDLVKELTHAIEQLASGEANLRDLLEELEKMNGAT